MVELNMLSKYTRNDGNNEEGLGSILQSQLHLYAYCRMMNYHPCMLKLNNISHHQYTTETPESYTKKLNDFFSFSSYESQMGDFIDPHWLIKEWGEKFNKEKKEFIQELNEMIVYDGPFFFSKEKKTVSIHIRALNNEDVCYNQNREYFDKTKENYFINLIENIIDTYKENLDIHIFSQGNEESFKIFTDKFNCKLHINEDIITTFYHLMYSDFLLTSNSSLSWCAHLFGNNKYVYSRDNFFHSWYPETILVDIHGNIKK
jgi:hypothetical protein